MSEMPEFTKSFSVVDVLAYFAPGAIFTLFSYWIISEDQLRKVFVEPITTMFPDNELALAVYFCIISYLFGMLLSELSYWIWKLRLWEWIGNLKKTPLKSIMDWIISPYHEDPIRMTGLPRNELLRKEQLFKSYFHLCRCCTIVVPLLLIEKCKFGGLKCITFGIGVIIEVVLIIRANRFRNFQKEYKDAIKSFNN